MAFLTHLRVSLLGTLLCLFPALSAQAQEPKATNTEYKEDEVMNQDLKVTRLKLDGKDVVLPVVWADSKGSALFLAETTGVLRRIQVPDFKEPLILETGQRCSGLALSAEGVLMALPDAQQVWVIDPEKLTVKQKVPVPGVQYVAATPKLAFGYAASGTALYLLYLKTGKSVPLGRAVLGNVGLANPVVAPDGSSLFTRSDNQIFRLKIQPAGGLTYTDNTPKIGSGSLGAGIQISPDSKYVCLPTGNGNVKDLKGHPAIGPYSTYVYPASSLGKAAFALEQGAYPTTVGFDPVAGRIYAQNTSFTFMVYGMDGMKKKDYRIGSGRREFVRQYLVHPDGGKVLVLVDEELQWVELPKS
jgi:hypothetical protein